METFKRIGYFAIAFFLGVVLTGGIIAGWYFFGNGFGTSQAVKVATANTNAAVSAIASDSAGITATGRRLSEELGNIAGIVDPGTPSQSAGINTVASGNGNPVNNDNRRSSVWNSDPITPLIGGFAALLTAIALLILRLFRKKKISVAATVKTAEKETTMRVETELRIAEGYAIDIYDEVTGLFKATLNAGEKLVEKDWKTVEGWAKQLFGSAIQEVPKGVSFVVRNISATPSPAPTIQGTAVPGS